MFQITPKIGKWGRKGESMTKWFVWSPDLLKWRPQSIRCESGIARFKILILMYETKSQKIVSWVVWILCMNEKIRRCCLFSTEKNMEVNLNVIFWFRLGYIEEAAQYIRRALKVNPRCAVARENFENVCGHLVERWHFRMLNDVRRNTAYQAALEQGIKRGGACVLDIGAGTALLR